MTALITIAGPTPAQTPAMPVQRGPGGDAPDFADEFAAQTMPTPKPASEEVSLDIPDAPEDAPPEGHDQDMGLVHDLAQVGAKRDNPVPASQVAGGVEGVKPAPVAPAALAAKDPALPHPHAEPEQMRALTSQQQGQTPAEHAAAQGAADGPFEHGRVQRAGDGPFEHARVQRAGDGPVQAARPTVASYAVQVLAARADQAGSRAISAAPVLQAAADDPAPIPPQATPPVPQPASGYAPSPQPHMPTPLVGHAPNLPKPQDMPVPTHHDRAAPTEGRSAIPDGVPLAKTIAQPIAPAPPSARATPAPPSARATPATPAAPSHGAFPPAPIETPAHPAPGMGRPADARAADASAAPHPRTAPAPQNAVAPGVAAMAEALPPSSDAGEAGGLSAAMFTPEPATDRLPHLPAQADMGPRAQAAATAQAVARQMAEAVPLATDGALEITLNPEELGRLRLSLSTADGAPVLHVTAERADTLDLVRRHVELLAREFAAHGFAGLNVALGQDRQPAAQDRAQPGGDAATKDPAQPEPPVAAASASPAAHPLRGESLDIRL